MYMSIPIMSLVMEINGPVAMAGSIFSFVQCHGHQGAENGGKHDYGEQAKRYRYSNRLIA